jgi:dGTPase
VLETYASLPQYSKGRKFLESENKFRDCYQRDRDRIIHSSAFRKLMYKTQVFTNYDGDYYRTRLTHSLEVAQIARSIARRVKVNEDLTETIALAHDIGHPPFGHAGEDGLKLAAEKYYEFDHNAQSIRLLTELENHYIDYNGLNLTWETLEGLVKHNGPIKNPHQIIDKYNTILDLELNSYSSLEAQIAAISDDIAYNAHDIDDGIRSGLIFYQDLLELPIIGVKIKEFELKYPNAEKTKIIYKSLRKMIGILIDNVITVTLDNIKEYNIRTPQDVREFNSQLVNFSSEKADEIKKIKEFLYKNLYFNYKINRVRSKVKRIIRDLFDIFFSEPECLPDDWYKNVKNSINNNHKAQIVCDFIAGMTDRFAIQEHQRLFDTYIMFKQYPH